MRAGIVIMCGVMIFSLLSVVPVHAELYRWVDVEGTLHISNLKPEWWTEDMDRITDYHAIIAPEEDGTDYKELEPGEDSSILEPSDQLEDARAEAPEDSPSFIGVTTTRIYHTPTCPKLFISEGDKKVPIPEDWQRGFESMDKAVAAGYSPCPVCIGENH